MRKFVREAAVVITSFLVLSCSPSSKYEGPVVEPSAITKDMMSWLYYERDNVQWSGDFDALDAKADPMRRKDFLEMLSTGKYFPVRIKTRDSSLCYQLYPFQDGISDEIKDVIKGKAQMAGRYLAYEGSSLPGFDFVDLRGKIYNRETTKGKVVVLNCWFIHCQACNEEIPDLNKIVEETGNRNDVVFIGLAFDKADSLRRFLSTKKFNYAIVADKENYLMKDLGIVYYPTHIIINREGKIVKIIDGGINEFITALNKELVAGN